jgi:XisI protein
MDKSIKYEQTVSELLEEYVTFWGSSEGVYRRVLADKAHHTYQLIAYGWQDGKRYVHNVAFHLEIIDGKVWIHQNNTEAMIADELIEKGVDKKDIILGFIAPNERIYSGFATA